MTTSAYRAIRRRPLSVLRCTPGAGRSAPPSRHRRGLRCQRSFLTTQALASTSFDAQASGRAVHARDALGDDRDLASPRRRLRPRGATASHQSGSATAGPGNSRLLGQSVVPSIGQARSSDLARNACPFRPAHTSARSRPRDCHPSRGQLRRLICACLPCFHPLVCGHARSRPCFRCLRRLGLCLRLTA